MLRDVLNISHLTCKPNICKRHPLPDVSVGKKYSLQIIESEIQILISIFQVGRSRRGLAKKEAEAQQKTTEPASRPGEHHHRAGCHSG